MDGSTISTDLAMMIDQLTTEDTMFTKQNTEGYTDSQLEKFNHELAQRLTGIEPYTDEYYEIERAFSDEISRH